MPRGGARSGGRPPVRLTRSALALAGVVIAAFGLGTPAVAATMCHTAGAAPERLATATATASSKFLEATSHAMLALKAAEESAPAFAEHRKRATAALDSAIAGYRRALTFTDDLQRGDEFLRARAFDRLRLT